MRRLGGLAPAAAFAGALALFGALQAGAADESVPLPPLRPPELGGPDPVADWSDPDAPLEATPPKPAVVGAAADSAEPTGEASLDGDAEVAASATAETDLASGPEEEPEHEPEAGADAPADDESASDDDTLAQEALAEERPAFEPAEAERCEAELRALGARFTRRDPIEDDGCGAERPLELEALPGGIAIEGQPALLRCGAALAVATWGKEVVEPSALLHLDTAVKSLVVSTSYYCRERAGSSTPSQHAFANALDVMGLRFADDSVMLIAPRPDSAEPERAFQAAIRGGACAYFTTVLGPTTNAAHDDHLHLDVKQRSSGYRVCE